MPNEFDPVNGFFFFFAEEVVYQLWSSLNQQSYNNRNFCFCRLSGSLPVLFSIFFSHGMFAPTDLLSLANTKTTTYMHTGFLMQDISLFLFKVRRRLLQIVVKLLPLSQRIEL
jgi:hypothetical protein